MKVSFAHNVYNRTETLKETINIEKKYFPECKVCVAYNGNISTFDNEIKWIKFSPKSHKAGCSNGFLIAIKNTVINDSDVTIFSHDDISIKNIGLVKKHIKSIMDDEFDVIIRKPTNIKDKNYMMMETVYMSKSFTEKIGEIKLFKNDDELPKDHRGSPSPEVFLYNLIMKYGEKIKVINYVHQDSNYNDVLEKTLGVFHKNAGLRGWND